MVTGASARGKGDDQRLLESGPLTTCLLAARGLLWSLGLCWRLLLGLGQNELLGVDDQPPQRRLPKPLEEFRALSNFRQAVAEEARKSSRDADQLEDEWLETLSRIHVGGRRPKDAADYLFIFEAIRRAIERR